MQYPYCARWLQSPEKDLPWFQTEQLLSSAPNTCMCMYTYFFPLFLNFFPPSPSGPHFSEYLHWDVTEECEVRLVCKVRTWFLAETRDRILKTGGDGQEAAHTVSAVK